MVYIYFSLSAFSREVLALEDKLNVHAIESNLTLTF